MVVEEAVMMVDMVRGWSWGWVGDDSRLIAFLALADIAAAFVSMLLDRWGNILSVLVDLLIWVVVR